ncbi:MAG: cell division protein SepF [Clostridia bacterium]|nr:cell division protein SepF [Clostridia bacterium]
MYDEADEGGYYDDETVQPDLGVDENAATIGGSGYDIMGGGNAIELKVVKPQNFEDSAQVADHLLSKRTVVLNLEDTNKEAARRILDFLTGVAYSIGGNIKKVATSAYVVTPSNVDVSEGQIKQKAAAAAQAAAEETAE